MLIHPATYPSEFCSGMRKHFVLLDGAGILLEPQNILPELLTEIIGHSNRPVL